MRPHKLFRPHRILALLLFTVTLVALTAGAFARGRVTGAHQRAAATGVRHSLIIGLSEGAAGWGGASTGPHLSLLQRRTGTSWVRDPFWWSQIEPRRNHFQFGYYDHYVLALARHHMHVVAQLMGSPGWAAPSTFSVPADSGAYAAYVTAVLDRYGPTGTFWRKHSALRGSAITAVEIWNEPYFATGNGNRYDPGRYARLIRAAGSAAHRVSRAVTVLMEADMVPHHYNVWRWWVDSLYRAVPDLNRYFDAVSIHDFGTDVTHLAPVRNGEPYQNFNRTRRIEDVRRQFVRHHAAAKPFWIMEMGWSTCHVRSIDCVSETSQRGDLQTMYGYLRGPWSSWVRAAFVYRFSDNPPAVGVQDAYGLLRTNGSAKPALSVFETMTAASG